jgi:hypothetical protein
MDSKKFEEYLKNLEINEIYDLYQLDDEFTQEALEIMERIALEKDGFKLKKENKMPKEYLVVILIIAIPIISKILTSIFVSLGQYGMALYSLGFAVIYFFHWLEHKDLNEYERKIKKLREKKGMSEIIVAITDKDFNKFNELLKLGRNIHKKTKDGWTSLMYAVQNNEIEIVKILIANGADANEKTKKNISAKTLAHENKFEEMRLLIEKY